ncbi:hypothetical protein AGMMS5026_05990 [Endomicrobiia bacterium]|nr:hypothetical protein AGMMS49523_09680 [Endomicrobiia bacterium]GHT12985.1 hypothetical protein AGMMS49571_05920 [Endomicrobiia bacterium]GHT18581.1 hypothetical protein AGMMS49929_00550 [Endomicrobiia bacterium]GHT28773.1 hypothetical protein AGMMS49995_10160 [Endomicrobiia bacterium]GHT30816.1 hypothetical protein AGMMS5026_05990 [Endomicrobiia bacterium]
MEKKGWDLAKILYALGCGRGMINSCVRELEGRTDDELVQALKDVVATIQKAQDFLRANKMDD